MISLQVCGTEWVSHVTCRRKLMDELGVANGNGYASDKGGGPPTHDVFHGMVAREKRAITSSKEGALLIDDLAEWLDEQIDADPERPRVARATIPSPTASPPRSRSPTSCCSRPRSGSSSSPRTCWSRTSAASAGTWRGRRRTRRHCGGSGGARRRSRVPLRGRAGGDAPLATCAAPSRSSTSSPLARYLSHFARWYAEEERSPRVERVSRTVIDQWHPRSRTGGVLMRTLLVDNHDSYTYNVFHLLAAASGEEPVVVNNDAVSWRVLSRSDFDAIVLSPGPGRPERWHDFGVCRDILRYSEIPVLGICLGHQGIGNLLEGGVSSAPMAMHGRLSRVRHDDSGLFRGIPQDFSVVRYHSLAITSPMGPEGREVAWAEDGVVMGIEHRTRPMWGVQFHPESVATEHGRAIVENFYALAAGHSRSHPRAGARGTTTSPVGGARRSQASGASRSGLELRMRSLEGEPDTEAVYERLFGSEDYAFWLDSADAPTWLGQSSYLGTSAGAERWCHLRRRRRRAHRRRCRRQPQSNAARSSTCSAAICTSRS